MILQNCRVIEQLSGGIYGDAVDVQICDGRIKMIAPKIEVEGETVFDCGGRTLLPGLWDIHTHLTGLSNEYSEADTKAPMKLLIGTASLAKKYLDYGFTSIRDCGSCMRAANYTRDMIAKGLIEGPRVIASGEIVGPTENSVTNELGSMDTIADGADEVRRAVRREFAEQADFIKIYASGSAFNPKGKPLQPIMMEDEVRMAVKVAEMKGSYVAAHAHCDEAIRMCIETGVRTIEHATYLSDETLNLLLKTKNCYLVPTLAAMYCNPGSDSPFWKERLGAMLQSCSVTLNKAYRAGCKMGFGTDSAPGRGQYAHGIEFEYRKEYLKMESIDILLQATKYSAEICGFGDVSGMVGEGYEADLLLVNGKPEEDISVMYHRPDYVFQAGRLIRDNTKEAYDDENC